ncbi:hypothetical protein [Acuticoccus kandeliae]|uniref:hypothetical protein n=1 Tax=Acuticoccus kandeliae TaxID=2073160 RepID=UPI000D3E1CAF|nr:hypothetical protein [Acuticoccus kandeliae]
MSTKFSSDPITAPRPSARRTPGGSTSGAPAAPVRAHPRRRAMDRQPAARDPIDDLLVRHTESLLVMIEKRPKLELTLDFLR